MKYPKCRNYHPKEKVETQPASSQKSDCEVRHYMVDIFNSYAWIIFKRAPWYIWIYSFFVLLYDLLMNNGFHNFVLLYTSRVMAPGGILGQYKDIIEECQPSLAAGNILRNNSIYSPNKFICVYLNKCLFKQLCRDFFEMFRL